MRTLLFTVAFTALAAGAAQAATIGVSMARFDDNFQTLVRDAIDAEAHAKGVVTQVEDGQADTEKQISQVQNFIAQKVDAIIVDPVDTSITPKITALAVEARIPLVYVNSKPEDKALPPTAAFVGSDEKVSGTLEAKALVACMGGKGNLVILQGGLSNNAALDRTADVEAVVAGSPGIKVVQKQSADWSRVKATDLVSNWITNGVEIKGVAANNDEMAVGAILAFKRAGIDPKTLCIGGIDATADGLAEIGAGTLAVTVFQDAKGQGRGAVDTALRLMKGERVPSMVDVPFERVGPDNYKTYLSR